MQNMQTVAVYSEAGGVGKTTAAVSLAMTSADAGHQVVLIDLDPRAKATAWTGVEPVGEGLHVGAILGNDDPTGWAEELAAPSKWSTNLRVIPSARGLSNREADRDDYAELRLRASLDGLQADVVVIDCANRQGGPLTLSALHAADSVLYAATATDSGVDGVRGAQHSIKAFKRSRELLGAPTTLTEAGVVVTRDGQGAVWSNSEDDSIEEMRDLSNVLTPFIPRLSVVSASRLVSDWYGGYRKGRPVLEAYTEVMRKVIR
jgi:cellulose biosynthesis protein BcsQ